MDVVQLTRDAIISSAIEILDTYGLADMTMRRLAKHLGVVPGALYWHIPNKQSLIEAIAENILQPVWDAADVAKPNASDLCTILRSTITTHRDGAEVVSAALPVGDVTGRLLDALADALRRENCADADAETVARTLLHYTMGATVHEQSREQLNVALGNSESTGKSEDAEFSAGIALIMAGVLGVR